MFFFLFFVFFLVFFFKSDIILLVCLNLHDYLLCVLLCLLYFGDTIKSHIYVHCIPDYIATKVHSAFMFAIFVVDIKAQH